MVVTESHSSDALVTKTDAMNRLRVSLRTVDRLIATKELVAVRITKRTTRITKASLDALAAPADQSSLEAAAAEHGTLPLDTSRGPGDGE